MGGAGDGEAMIAARGRDDAARELARRESVSSRFIAPRALNEPAACSSSSFSVTVPPKLWPLFVCANGRIGVLRI